MKRLVLSLGIAFLTFSAGVIITAIFWLYKLPHVIKLESPTPFYVATSSCFPGLSVKVEKRTSASSYFSHETLPENKSGHQFRTDWYSKHLRAMHEDALTSLSEEESYRFLWLRTFHHPIAVHLSRFGSKYFIVAKQLNGAGGYEPGILEINYTRPLSENEWNQFMTHLEIAQYWQMAADEGTANDGAQWILEGYREGRYHVVDRQCPTGTYREADLYLLRTAGLLKDIPQEDVY
jgi:hypothetical protein